MTTNSRVILRGAGDEMPGKPAADIIVILQELPHERFTRKKHDLYIKQTITLVEALAGCEFMVTHLDGRNIVIRSKPGDIIKPGQELCVLNEGFPVYKQPFDKGRLIVTFDVAFPTTLSSDQVQQVLQTIPAIKQSSVSVNPQDEIEECSLADVDPEELKKEQQQRHHDHAFADEDDDEDMPQGAGQGCRVG